MGCYDTVNFNCPDCGAQIENQSKAGPCDLKTYSRATVPLSIAGGMVGDDVECPECDKQWRVALDGPATAALRLDGPASSWFD